MSSRCLLFSIEVAVLLASPVMAEPIGPFYKVVRSGVVAPMGFHYYVSHACRSLGAVTVNLVTPPQNGQLSVATRRGFAAFAPASAFAACNGAKVPGVQVYYQSSPGFTGEDSYVVERVFPNGDAHQFRITVSVR